MKWARFLIGLVVVLVIGRVTVFATAVILSLTFSPEDARVLWPWVNAAILVVIVVAWRIRCQANDASSVGSVDWTWKH